MRQIFGGAFWANLDNNINMAAIWCVALTLIWAFISIGLYCFEGSGSYFEIKKVLIFKFILVAVIFLGRYLLFTKYRHQERINFFLGICFFIAVGAQTDSFIKNGGNWLYILLKIADAFVWGIFAAVFFENIEGLFDFWRHPQKITGALFTYLHKKAKQNTIALGLLLTLLAGLLYYYLTSFYLIDTILYSYLLLAAVLFIGLGFYFAIRFRLIGWLQLDINLLDLEIDSYLQWRDLEDFSISQKLISLQYLTTIRSYLAQIGKPGFPWRVGGGYLIFSIFVLALPYIFGLAIPVGSIK
jgi:hypothetical protein